MSKVSEIIERVGNIKDSLAEKKNFAKRGGIITHMKKHFAKRRVLLYGGSAMNYMLPKEARIYSDREIPDIDAFVVDDKEEGKRLVDILVKNNYRGVAISKGLHEGTTKVFAEGIGVADLTKVSKEAFEVLWKDRVRTEGLDCVSARFLFHTMFRILSQPFDASFRWEKTYTRLRLLHKHFGKKSSSGKVDFQKKLLPEIVEFAKETGTVLGGAPAMALSLNNQFHGEGDWVNLYTTSSAVKRVGNALKKKLSDAGVEGVKVSLVQNKFAMSNHVDVTFDDTCVRVYYLDDCRSASLLDGVLMASAMTEMMHLTAECIFEDTPRVSQKVTDDLQGKVLRLKDPERYLKAKCVGSHTGLPTMRLNRR